MPVATAEALIIRPFQPSDADALAGLFHASVRNTGVKYYSPEQVEAWSLAVAEPGFYLCLPERCTVLVATGAQTGVVGYGTLDATGHIDHLYCRWDRVGSGIGSALYASIEIAAKAAGIKVLTVDASEAARRLFERRGFTMHSRNDFLLGDVPIHNYRMSREIG